MMNSLAFVRLHAISHATQTAVQRAASMCSLALLIVMCSSIATAADQPNILWLTCEDNNVNWVGCYGNPHADTPNIDALAAEGFQYMHCYANAPVCAPSRSTWITGVHALSMGTHPMRSRYPIPHDTISYYPDLLKKAGYFVGNATKTDYNIGGRSDGEAWDTNKADWAELKKQQPFFMVINNTKSHESRAFGDVNNTTHSPDDVRLAKYHPDIPDIRKNYAHYHDQMKKMDADIGLALEELERSGLAENTIVVHNSDHGGVIARSKRFLFNSGTHCPLIIRIPEKFKHLRPAKPGSRIERLVSFIDMTKTWLTVCGAETPDYLQGKVFLGATEETRDYHVSYRTRMDERCDNVRAIRDRRFLYIRNYMPYAPWGQHLNYLWTMRATQAWEEHHRAGKTDAVTGRFFGTKPMHELYDTSVDPDNVNNLVDDPKYANEVARLSKALDEWQLKHFDSGLLPESEVVKRSEESGKTIYELVRDPSLYDLKGYQAASGRALGQRSSNLAGFYRDLGHADAGIRYWAIVGCFNLQESTTLDMAVIRKSLDDASHHVRIMAAWILYRGGDKAAGQACWNELLKSSSYASLKIFNIVDWIGDGTEPYAEAMKSCEFSHGGYVGRMQQYLGVKPKQQKTERNRKTEK
ncbi:MAG: sulfatase [Planctomycetota bacterium]|nr:sulfatase [Planctomycetota bacterium]